MELSGETHIKALPTTVWSALNNPEVLMACIPGCESVEITSPTEKSVRLMVRIGPVRARFVGKIRMEDVVENERCLMRFEGSGGAAGMASGESIVTLHPDGDQTILRYSVKAAIGGKLGQIGGRMVDGAAKMMADQFFSSFNNHLTHPVNSQTIGNATRQPLETSHEPKEAILANLPTDGERSRITWFLLGSLATGFGIWIGSHLG